jgi:putative heme-binding domain-containing protein
VVDERGVRLVRDWIQSLPKSDAPGTDVEAGRAIARDVPALLAGVETDEAIPRLLASMNGCLALLDHFGSRSGDAELKTRDRVAALAITHTNALVRDLFQRLLPPDQRRRTLGADFDPQAVLAMTGNEARGREVFLGVAQCSRCHVTSGGGRSFGPDLKGIALKYTRAQLIEQILYPSRIIAPEFKSTTVTLNDGSERTGFILSRTADELVLRDENLAEHHLKPAEVKEAREAALSAMPEGLLASLTAQETADLLEYLSSQRAPTPGVR